MAARIVGLALLLAAPLACPHLAASQDVPTVIVRLSATADVRTGLADRSRERLEALFGPAGIEIRWRDCRPPADRIGECNAPPLPNEAIVRLVSGRFSSSDDVCGVAFVPTREAAHFISIFIDCIDEAARTLRVSDEVVIACTLAHEIGHLLLGPGHGSLGLMQRRPRPLDWQRAVHGGLTFTPGEVARLRRALIERAR